MLLFLDVMNCANFREICNTLSFQPSHGEGHGSHSGIEGVPSAELCDWTNLAVRHLELFDQNTPEPESVHPEKTKKTRLRLILIPHVYSASIGLFGLYLGRMRDILWGPRSTGIYDPSRFERFCCTNRQVAVLNYCSCEVRLTL
jgi:hypothetical protein